MRIATWFSRKTRRIQIPSVTGFLRAPKEKQTDQFPACLSSHWDDSHWLLLHQVHSRRVLISFEGYHRRVHCKYEPLLFFFFNLSFFHAAGGHHVFVGFANSIVHSFMYSYYLLTIMYPEYKQSIWWKKHITQLQMVSNSQRCTVKHLEGDKFVHYFKTNLPNSEK